MECGNEEIKRTPKIYHPVNIYKILQLYLTIIKSLNKPKYNFHTIPLKSENKISKLL